MWPDGLTTPSADHGGGRAAACGPLLKRSLSFPLPSVHEEIADDLGQAQAGDQAAAAPPGEDRPHAHGLPPAPLAGSRHPSLEGYTLRS